ncbi:MAG: LysR substrate-binding domain-containing protein [Chthoniobacter sp.]|uniref:LysR substrate-binding domain-containing protein n=1 Tax=Chthoniobacter sp. TaxID=2510640 RepID=UPI0032A97B05
MDYSLRELECFTAVAEELSFTRAAQKLHLAQPPLSRHIRALEDKLGAALFDRSGRKVALTTAGAVFYEETRTVLPQLVRAGETTRRFVSGETARLRLGFVSAVLSPELVEILRAFRERHPAVQLLMQDSPPAEQLAALRHGSLDGGFIGLPPDGPTPGIQFVPWRREPLAAFVPFGHALAARRQIDLRELAGEALVAVSGEAAPAFSAYLRKVCGQAGFRPRIVLESPRAQAVAIMVAAGTGIALLPTSLARVVGDAAAIIPLKKAPSVAHVFARNAGAPSPAMRDFVALLTGGGMDKGRR